MYLKFMFSDTSASSKDDSITCAQETSTAATCTSNTHTSVLESNDTPGTSSEDWSSSYKVPWHKFPKKLMEKCSKEERPDPCERREMIRIIMDDITALHVAPKRKELRKVAHQILGKFRKSFADVINDELIGDGSATLLQQLESRKENLQRMTMPRKRPKSSTADRDQPPRKNSKMELDSFGCIKTQWNPELPVGESQDTQEEKKKFLQNEYDKLYWSVDNVSKLMTATYSSQRHGINDKKNIEDLLKEWPFLAEEKWLFEHFHRLTEIDLTERLNDAFEKKGSRLLMYLKTKNAPPTLVEAIHKIKIAVKQCANQQAVTKGLPGMLAAYFKEDLSVLIRCYDVSTCTYCMW